MDPRALHVSEVRERGPAGARGHERRGDLPEGVLRSWLRWVGLLALLGLAHLSLGWGLALAAFGLGVSVTFLIGLTDLYARLFF